MIIIKNASAIIFYGEHSSAASQLSRRPKELLASHQLQPLETQEEKNVESQKGKKKKVGILWYLSAIEQSIQELTTTRFNPIE